jgi:hypothetical protein
MNVKDITLEEGKALLAEMKAKKQKPKVSAIDSGGKLRKPPLIRDVVAWGLHCEGDLILKAPPTLFPWVPHERATWPFRYMTTKAPLSLSIWNQRRANEPEYTEKPLPIGTRVKIVMVSRFGDVGITDDLTADNGYHLRIDIPELDQKFENFSNEP